MDIKNQLLGIQYVYFGNLLEHLPQYKSGLFHGLALHPKSDKDIQHDARDILPFESDSILGFQSEDVFEHLEYATIPGVLDEIYRCLQIGGKFRMSMPDYNSPLLRRRSVYDSDGMILCDLSMGGSVSASCNTTVTPSFMSDGDAHLWFPTYTHVMELILASDIRKCREICFQHVWVDRQAFILNDFEAGYMPVMRIPPNDMRADGKPISLVVDFWK